MKNSVITLLIYKKEGKRNCKNYRGITLLSVPGKVFVRIIEEGIRNKIDRQASENLMNKNK